MVVVIASAVVLATLAVVSKRPLALLMSTLRAIAARGARTSTVGTLLRTLEDEHAAMRTMLTDASILWRAWLLAIAVVLVLGLWTFLLFRAIGLSVSPLLIITLMPIVTMIALLPVSVLGLKDCAFVFFFGGLGVAASAAFAVSLASYAVIIVSSLVLGLLATVMGPPLPGAATKLKN